ncbi:GNAT family N-acetyltransferase [Methanocella arvoryzae]|uniref:Acetyltransferase (GNAT family) n=1 Tax=Methanocella arvoryzae (strain DSM 22066 / NBRC 105507 / MRE50) TaxID=351160 RepID=Q0W1E7_METAR|nr:GNAT family N-acetyltransferase [Methanocella arvoryzae]CAJ37796.1 putative acetyltransferase (GNAT family) [Methanocella arvoryzae MRE50]
MEHYIIQEMSVSDQDQVCSIFRNGVASGDHVLDADDPAEWIDFERGENLVAKLDDKVVGWAIVTPLEEAELPQGVGRIGVFVDPEYRGKGIGRLLLNSAIQYSEEQGIDSLICGIVPDNLPAVMLHKSCGFKALGMLRDAGMCGGRKRDAVLLQHTYA